MAQIINITTTKKAVDDRKIAEFFLENEMSDFEEVWNLLLDQSKYSVLFKEVDFSKYYGQIMNDVRQKHFLSNEELALSSVDEIVKTYSERMDIDELRQELNFKK